MISFGFTPFGVLYLLALALLLSRRGSLIYVLPTAAMLHAPAVAVITFVDSGTQFGITPWQTVGIAAALALAGRARTLRGIATALPASTQALLACWSVLIGVCVLTAVLLPICFEGIPTYNNQILESLMAGPSPLELRLGNFAQAGNLGLIGVLMLYAAVTPPPTNWQALLSRSLLIAAAISLGFSLLQRALDMAGMDAIEMARTSLNPGYGHHLGYLYAGDGVRVGWPFSEPSYASVWFAALAVAGTASWVVHGSRDGLTLLIVGGLGLMNSFSGTGVVAAGVCGGLVVAWAFASVRSASRPGRRKRSALLVATLISVLSLLGTMASRTELTHPTWGAVNTLAAVFTFMKEKFTDHRKEVPSRWDSNLHAAALVVQTHGIGVGLGSNRASSYLATLVSNVGIAPSLALLGICVWQVLLLCRLLHGQALATMLTAGSATTFVGISLGIPDIVWPVWWLFVLLTFLAVGWSQQLQALSEPTKTPAGD